MWHYYSNLMIVHWVEKLTDLFKEQLNGGYCIATMNYYVSGWPSIKGGCLFCHFYCFVFLGNCSYLKLTIEFCVFSGFLFGIGVE